MSLGDKRRKFTEMIALTIQYALFLGYKISFDKEHCNHMENSLHYEGLAKDFNLYKDGKYLTKTEDHEPVGLFWEFLGGSWGGRFQDGNHYSCEWMGRK